MTIELDPLHEKLYNAMPEDLPWSMVEIQANFPTETYWPLYRALNRLEKDRRVRFHKLINKKKYYNKRKQNDLPHIFTSVGEAFPLSVFVNQRTVNDKGVWLSLDARKANKIPLLFGQLFVIAAKLQGPEQKKDWSLIREELLNARGALTTTVAWIDSVVDHPAMSGDMEKFNAVFGGKDAPSVDELNEFIRWSVKVKGEQDIV